jgi:hypothetical protein
MDQPGTTPVAPSRRPAPRRNRRILAGVLAALGIVAIALSLVGGSDGSDLTPARTAGSLTGDAPAGTGTQGSATSATGAGIPAAEASEPTNGPGGVGQNPKKTGLPAKPADGLVRTGTEEEGCFPDMRSYLEEWHRTEQEPDPCFLSQPASGQKQPGDVQRSYNGEKF